MQIDIKICVIMHHGIILNKRNKNDWIRFVFSLKSFLRETCSRKVTVPVKDIQKNPTEMFKFPYLTSLMKKNEHCRKYFTRVAKLEAQARNEANQSIKKLATETMNGVKGERVATCGEEGRLLHWKKAVKLKFEEERAAARQSEIEGQDDEGDLTWLKNWELESILRQTPPTEPVAGPSSGNSSKADDAIQCKICDEVFTTRRQLSQHKRLEHFPSWEGGTKEFCYLPYFVEPKRFSLLRGTLASGQKECGLCEKWLSDGVKKKVGPYLEELRTKLKEKAVVKSEKKKDNVEPIPTNKSNAKRRGRKGKNMNKRVCELCSKVLSNRKGLERHMLIHTGEKPFPCDVCGKPFRRKDNCVRHKKTAHLFKKPRKPRRRKVDIASGNNATTKPRTTA